MTHRELLRKYDAAKTTIKRWVECTAETAWDFHTTDSCWYSVLVYPPGKDGDFYFEVYDRFDSIPDREAELAVDSTLWVILYPEGELEEINAPTLEEALIKAIVAGWLPGQPDPTL